MEAIVEQVIGLVSENESLRRENEELKRTLVNSEKFYNVALPVESVARLHSVSAYMVRNYIELGLIEKHPASKEAKIMVRASDALLLDFKELKHKAKFL